MNGKAGKAAEVQLVQPDGDLIIGIEDLLPGDILLCCPSDPKLHQWAITQVSGSPYTHAAIYIGDGMVAESNVRAGVKKNPIDGVFDGSAFVAVLRSQMVFDADRARGLDEFVEAVVANRRFYDGLTALRFPWASKKYFGEQLQHISDNYGTFESNDELARKRYICSAFVVACYIAVGIIDETAQVAYLPQHFSPGDIGSDVTFGWLLGYLVPEGHTVPPEEQNRFGGVWKDIGGRWWP